ncbi:amino acid adenylation domain-containing protein [Streptomyces sp. 3MP-14]|uniref:Amino acid adenylation domain-containing protein n=1 Tax=Streptomyces mimosae TaxID=2586635 RepID=A0A5N6A0U6_9ACTN|nr:MULTISPECIES: hybrid non-ribosomal peptide synthetase/type I polyketide synthase [Streptomyces]KAB8161290.1 amino acid adenylation domain-containing protein [Streptomyces mimosae]KAB8173092.1 amino acid adenylation domain-containing protein [Streptomyces sp. 3MP-14]
MKNSVPVPSRSAVPASPESTADADRFAIVGIGCRFPGGANDHRSYWRNLVEGRDCLTPTPRDRYDVATLGSADRDKPGRLVGGRGGYIDGFDAFDPAFFGISPREAAHLDPQQRKLLEVAWEALEDGGQLPGRLAGTDVGVFVGAFTLDYKILQFADLDFETLAAHTATGTMMTMVSNRISYCFDFRGPSLSLDTACSSSLVAVHLACASLRRGETGLALAGGTLLHSAPQYTIAETKGGFLSPAGRSRPWDASADGYVRAEGVALVAIRRLADALADGDPIHAVIIGSGINQDGHTAGITVPSADAQVELIQRVCADAGITPGDLQYVEAHATSTAVGDPIEAAALARALAVGRTPGSTPYVGSVKANIGHTESAAGVAGLIKAALALKHRTIPPQLHVDRLNPAIDEASLPFRIPGEATPWPAHAGPARAGVNAFGFGGTNAHVLLEEPPSPTESAAPETPQPAYTVLPLTARADEALPELAGAVHHELTDTHVADVAWTLAHRREHLGRRMAVAYSTAEELAEALAAAERGEPHRLVSVGQRREGLRRRLVWVFTGMGPQWWAMGRRLYAEEPVYREAIDRCDREFSRLVDWSLREELLADEERSRMAETWLAQPANFALQTALSALWRSRGVVPDAIVGHSTGEIAAFHEAGVYDLADAVAVAVHRSRLQHRLVGAGGMLAVGLPHAEAARRARRFGGRIDLAAVNGPGSVTLAGESAALAELADELSGERVFARFLDVDVPYHSAGMRLIEGELREALADLKPRRAQVPLYLTALPGAVARGEELDADYWWRNVRDTVWFQAAVDRLVDDGFELFLEIGPHPVLGHSIAECLARREVAGQALPSIRRGENEPERFARTLGALFTLGVDPDWHALHPAGRPVALPTYPWRHERYWTEPPAVARVRLGERDHPLLGRRLPGAAPAWETALDLERAPYLGDHRVEGRALFPAAGYLEMAAQAVRALTGGEHTAVAEVELRRALFLPEDRAVPVRLAFAPDSAAFHVVSTGGPEPVTHASGTVRSGQPRSLGGPLDLAAERRRAAERRSGAEVYALLAEHGYHYGPAFQGIEELWLGPDGALARLRLPAAAHQHEGGEHQLHPVLLDSCFQTLLAGVLAEEPAREGGAVRLPVAIDEVRLGPVGERPVWVRARVAERGAELLVGDLTLYGDDGAPLGAVAGFRAADVERAAGAVSTATVDGWLSAPVWDELPPLERESAPVPGRLLVLADPPGGVADALAALVAERGGHCQLVRSEGPLGVDAAEEVARSLAGLGTLDAVVDLRALDQLATDAQLSPTDAALGPYGLVALARTLLASGRSGRLHVVTRGSQAVRAREPVAPFGARAWGVARVLRYQELTGWPGVLLDLDGAGAGGPRGEAEALLAELLARGAGADGVGGAGEDEVALRGGRRFGCRLRPASGLTRPLPLRLRADGCYVVTGGFGALGRLLCRTLALRGARRLVLLGRTPLPERSRWREAAGLDERTAERVRFVAELEALGAQVTPVAVDVTDEAALGAWLDGHRAAALPPVRGVFHLAGEVRDTLLPGMDRETFAAVHDPKVLGAWALHRRLAEEPLEHFVLFASVAAWLPTAGQTNYAAGNAFLDALAHHRRALGLPALSVDWGPWATGMIEELGLVEHYRQARGMTSLAPAAGMAVLERIVGQDVPQLLVATVADWPTFLSWYATPPPLVAELAAGAAGGGADGSGGHGAAGAEEFAAAFAAADEAGRERLVAERFAAVVGAVLRVPADRLDAEIGLQLLGLDSLLAMELRARLGAELGVTLPVVALLSGATVGELRGQLREELLARLAEGTDDTEGAAVPVYTDPACYPLTQNQKALWFLKQLDPDGFAYNIGGAVEVRAALDPELMLEAFRRLLARHPQLRANFLLEDGSPVQRIAPEPREDSAVFDVADQPWEAIHQLIIREYRRPYDLERDPLVRFRLLRRADDRWIITKGVHHIISDAISTFTFIEELLAVHEDLRRGGPGELPAPTTHYLDFLNWQNAFLASPEAERMFRYWRDQLPDETPVLTLPTDRPRPAVRTHNGGSEFFALDEELSARVHALAREHHTTVFMVLLAAYYLLLHRYAGQERIVVGSPVTGRTREEFGSVYGYFVNPLPLALDLSGEPSVAELLRRVRTVVLGGLDHQEYPFVLLVERLGLAHDPSRSAVFQAMFILLHHRVATEKYGYRLEYIELPEEEGQFDLTLSAYEEAADGRFHCVLKYNSDLFRPETVARMAGHYTRLLDALTRAEAERSATALPMLGPDERARLLGEFSGARETVTVDRPVHELVSDWARRAPERVAVVLPDGAGAAIRLGYGELERRAGALARRLRARGVRPGVAVGLCLPKSPALLVALLAVWKAGGACVPLDPGYPAARLATMAATAGVALTLVEGPAPEGLPGATAALADLAEPCEEAPDETGDAGGGPAGLDDPAYLVFTSGSTGRPRAVAVSHRNLAHSYAGWRDAYRLESEVRVHLQLASPSFDVFFGDIARALGSGGRLVLVERELLFQTEALYRTMRQEDVDCVEFVPAVVRTLADYCASSAQRLDFLRLLVVGSDSWKVGEYRRLAALAGSDTRVVNSYGLTEATVDSCFFEGPTGGMDEHRMVPIGRPFPGATLWVLDERGEPVPPGVTGELWIGGGGVALGYVGEPELTAERFRTDLLGDGRRRYRTGDLATWDADGLVWLLGRADTQLKVRGHRIEPGEIEAELLAVPGVTQAVVTVRPDAAGEPALCGYWVPGAPGDAPGEAELRRHLAAALPTQLIPAHLTAVERLPLTPNGKVDLAALPAPAAGGDAVPYEAPVTLYEQRTAAHWRRLLGVERVGLHHDFFAVGGSSVRLIELIHALQVEFQVTIPVSELFRVTTLHGMAGTVEAVVTGRLAGARPWLTFNAERGPTLFCFPPAGGHGLVYRRLAERLPEWRLVAFNYLAGDDKVARYADRVAGIAPEGPLDLLGYSLGGNLAFEVAKALEARGRSVRRVLIVDSPRQTATFRLTERVLDAFDEELHDHLRRHTGSRVVAEETRQQARDYLEFASRTPNSGTVHAALGVITERGNAELYAPGGAGSWHGAGTAGTVVLRGDGGHAELLDADGVEHTAALVRSLLTGRDADSSTGGTPA